MTAQIIPFKVPEKPELRCSFCRRLESQVKRMFSNNVGGDAVRAICNDCAVKAKERADSIKE